MNVCSPTLIASTFALVVSSLPAPAAPGDKLDRSHLVCTFHEEFSSPITFYDPNTGKGTWKTNYFCGHQEDFTSRTLPGQEEIVCDIQYNGVNPFRQSNGSFTIIVANDLNPDDPKNAGHRYSSGVLTTEKSFSQAYGYFEMRAQLPTGPGLWPAFWLLSATAGADQEIDGMENLGHDSKTIFCSIHIRDLAPPINRTLPVPVNTVTRMHTYGVLWTADKIAWYVDDSEVAETPNPGLNDSMYLLVAIAVGGPWGGHPDAATRFPAKLVIDHIRAYQLRTETSGVRAQ